MDANLVTRNIPIPSLTHPSIALRLLGHLCHPRVVVKNPEKGSGM